jgi:hypothetical protein
MIAPTIESLYAWPCGTQKDKEKSLISANLMCAMSYDELLKLIL